MYLVVIDFFLCYIEVANLTTTDFTDYARKYDFIHLTSSPLYPQSNGEAARAVRTVKLLLSKGEDVYKALMAYRAIPLSRASSPAQLLMGWNIRTPVPISQEKLRPMWLDLQTFKRKDQDMMEKQASSFNKRHRTSERQELRSGQTVWVRNTKETGTISGPAQMPRSNNIDLPSGSQRTDPT